MCSNVDCLRCSNQRGIQENVLISGLEGLVCLHLLNLRCLTFHHREKEFPGGVLFSVPLSAKWNHHRNISKEIPVEIFIDREVIA